MVQISMAFCTITYINAGKFIFTLILILFYMKQSTTKIKYLKNPDANKSRMNLALCKIHSF